MFWFELKVQVNEEMASNLSKLLAFPTMMLSIGIIMIIIGLGLIGTVVFLYFKKKRRVVPPTVRIRVIKLFKFFSRLKGEYFGGYFFILTDTHNFTGSSVRKTSGRIA